MLPLLLLFHLILNRTIQNPHVIHILDPIWLGAQMLWALSLGWAGPYKPIVASYHTNIPTYLRFFGFGFLETAAWKLLRCLHAQRVFSVFLRSPVDFQVAAY
jgi:hypothetical protein